LHEDPGLVGSEVDPYFILLYYDLLIKGLLSPDEYNLTSLIELFSQISVPPDIAYLLSRLNELILGLDGELNNTRFHIDHARRYVDFKIFDKALDELYLARYWLVHANLTYLDLIDAVDELVRILPRYGLVSDKFYEIRGEISELLGELDSLLLYLLSLIEEVYMVAEEGYIEYYVGKNVTYISIFLNVSEAWVGDFIRVSGRLYTKNYSLPGRLVYIVVGDGVYSTYTGDDGWYDIVVRIPYIYVDSIGVKVFYVPGGDDTDFYTPAYNESRLDLLYFKTSAILDVDKVSYPGREFSFRLSVFPWFEGLERNVSIFIDNVLVGRYLISTPYTSFSYFIPFNMSIGQHVLNVFIEGYMEYSPLMVYSIFRVSYIDIDIYMNVTPTIILYPIDSISVDGRIVDMFGSPLSHELVKISVDGSVVEMYTDVDGYFNASFSSPPTLFGGAVKIVVYPSEPWYREVSRSISITVINIFFISLSLAAILGIIILLSRWFGRPEYVEGVSRPRRLVVPSRVVELERVARARRVPRRVDGGVVGIYRSIVELLSRYFEPPGRYETLREYYYRIRDRLGDLSSDFWRLTLLAEYELYSGKVVSGEEFSEANRIYISFREWYYEGV
jgi:hypothetical protein